MSYVDCLRNAHMLTRYVIHLSSALISVALKQCLHTMQVSRINAIGSYAIPATIDCDRDSTVVTESNTNAWCCEVRYGLILCVSVKRVAVVLSHHDRIAAFQKPLIRSLHCIAL